MSKKPEEEPVNAITMPLAEYRALSPEAQAEKRQEAIRLVWGLVKSFLIERDHIWILVCGSTQGLKAAACEESRIVDDDVIRELEERLGHPAYSIYRHEVMPKEGG